MASVHCAHDEMVPIERVIGNPRNPNTHPSRQLELLAKIIDAQGWRAPISVSKRSGYVVRGHGRLAAAKLLGEQKVPVDYQDYADEASEWADLIADNRLAELAEIDFTTLADLLQEIDTGELDMELTGFTDDDLCRLLTKYGDGCNIIEDDPPEPPADPITKPGDLWLLGEHRVLCGDSLDDSAVDVLMAGRKADMVFTDPPYNVAYGESKNPKHKIREIANDKQSPADWRKFCEHLAQTLRARCSADIYVWGAPGPDGMLQRLLLTEAGAHWSATIIWKKQQLVLSPANYQRIYEPCFYGWFGKSSFVADRKQTEVWEIDRPHDSKLHPTMKPIALCAHGIQNSSIPGAVVLDLFLGSGSTLIAAEQLGRTCYGMELDPAYCDVIVQRWENLTGKKAVLDDGRTQTPTD